ncbi:hypothetical protein DFJ73DRAFT_829076 [Zopfochytrium polystomum]|nr:hypothetical protein DFJ73DRAFT_829076 [Zopfochytrium polystomum]
MSTTLSASFQASPNSHLELLAFAAAAPASKSALGKRSLATDEPSSPTRQYAPVKRWCSSEALEVGFPPSLAEEGGAWAMQMECQVRYEMLPVAEQTQSKTPLGQNPPQSKAQQQQQQPPTVMPAYPACTSSMASPWCLPLPTRPSDFYIEEDLRGAASDAAAMDWTV